MTTFEKIVQAVSVLGGAVITVLTLFGIGGVLVPEALTITLNVLCGAAIAIGNAWAAVIRYKGAAKTVAEEVKKA